MHDPEVLAHRITIPWPRQRFGLTLVEVWHYEPGGADALTVCKRGSRWRWHVHHWGLTFPWLYAIRRRLLTRCAWCGGRHTKTDRVDVSHANWIGAAPRAPWWRGETNSVHSDCSSVAHARRLCLCDDPGLSHSDYGQCAFCGKFRAWRKVPTIAQRYLASLPVGSRIPAEKREWLKAEWAKVRAEREATDG
jgi:hypothetical protein